MKEVEVDAESDPLEEWTEPKKAYVMTSRQRSACIIFQSLARDMNTNGTREEKWTAALLELCADQVAAGHVAALAEQVRVWAKERAQQGG